MIIWFHSARMQRRNFNDNTRRRFNASRFNLQMRVAPTFNVALRALRRNKLRSVLTALGIIIGVGAVIAMVGIGNGAKHRWKRRSRASDKM